MGRLSLPPGASVYVDTQIVIYAVERHPRYRDVLRELWQPTTHEVVTSALTLLEVLVVPLRTANLSLQQDYLGFLRRPPVRSAPVTDGVLLHAAQLRAVTASLRTPDAVHAATCAVEGCDLFLTNDRKLRQLPGLRVQILDDVAPP